MDLESPTFPGSSIGKTQELNERTHPHLKLGQTMVSIPKVEPGDQVYCQFSLITSNIPQVEFMLLEYRAL